VVGQGERWEERVKKSKEIRAKIEISTGEKQRRDTNKNVEKQTF
jgi:hypothetical protein